MFKASKVRKQLKLALKKGDKARKRLSFLDSYIKAIVLYYTALGQVQQVIIDPQAIVYASRVMYQIPNKLGHL